MPARVSAWAIYDVFETKDDDKVFVGVVSDTQWRKFCEAFGLDELWAKEELRLNNGRVDARPWLKPQIDEVFKGYDKADLMAKLEATGVPFAPIAKPHDLFDDPHLNAGDGLSEVTLTDGDGAGRKISLPNMPLSIGGERMGVRIDLPRQGQHTKEVLAELGHDDLAIAKMVEDGIAAGE